MLELAPLKYFGINTQMALYSLWQLIHPKLNTHKSIESCSCTSFTEKFFDSEVCKVHPNEEETAQLFKMKTEPRQAFVLFWVGGG